MGGTIPRKNGRIARPEWADWPTKRLLDLRIRDLGVRLEGSWVEQCIDHVTAELEARDLRVRPHFWLADEWFCPSGSAGVALPFYLAHPRLMRLERSMMLEVEGGTPGACRRLLRHELGHAVQHAYGVHRRKRWQALFGLSSQPYPDSYRPNPASRSHVQHLDAFYAQSHPDEDFAETFAVWLHPRSSWRRRYREWPAALEKLEYVDALMRELSGVKPRATSRDRPWAAHRITKTLYEHYRAKREWYTPGYSDQWDKDLSRLFIDAGDDRHHETAAAFLRRNRREIRETVAKWTGEYRFTLDQVLKEMIGRCRELKLRAVGSERRLKQDFCILLTMHTMTYVYRGREWHAV